MKYQDLLVGLKQHKILPVYLLHGDERFLVQEAIDSLVNAIVDPGSRDFNFNSVYCRDTSAEELVSLAQTLPLMAEKRLVIAKELEAYKVADTEVLVEYLKDPSPSTCLVLVSNQGKYDKKAVLSAVDLHGASIRFYALLEREIVAWIVHWGRSRGIAVKQDAALYLTQKIGADLQSMQNELEKIAIFLNGRNAMSYDDIRAAGGDFKEYTSFDLATAVGRRNMEQSLVILSRLMQEGESPIGLLGAIAWNYRKLLQAKELEASGLGQDEIVKKLRVIFHQAAVFKEQMRRNTLHELRSAFGLLVLSDRALKSSGLQGRLVLERLIMKLCGQMAIRR